MGFTKGVYEQQMSSHFKKSPQDGGALVCDDVIAQVDAPDVSVRLQRLVEHQAVVICDPCSGQLRVIASQVQVHVVLESAGRRREEGVTVWF